MGPVLHQEMLLGTRRTRLHLFRWIYAAWLLIQVLFYSMVAVLSSQIGIHHEYVEQSPPIHLAGSMVPLLVSQQIILIFLVIPVFMAGAITDEKTRGTLQYLLTTDLTSLQILAGKMLARLGQVGLVAVTGLPLLFFLGAFSGQSLSGLTTIVLLTLVPLLGLAPLAILTSTLVKQTRDAVILFFLIVGIEAGFLWFFGGLEKVNPAWAIDSITHAELPLSREQWLRSILGMLLFWGGQGVVVFAFASWRLRAIYLRQLQATGMPGRLKWLEAKRAPLEDRPVFWKERHVEGLAPIEKLRRTPLWLGLAATFGCTALVGAFICWTNLPISGSFDEKAQILRRKGMAALSVGFGSSTEEFQTLGAAVMFLCSLVVGIRCSGTVSGEREKQTWEALLLSPLSAKVIIRQKMDGIMGASYPYLLAYAIPAAAFALLGGFEPFFWVILWLGVTLLATYFMGATGLRCSVRAKSSWRSLLATLGIGYVGGFLIYMVTSPILAILALIILLAMRLIDMYLETSLFKGALSGGGAQYFVAFQIASCIGLSVCFWLVAKFFIRDAQKWIADRDRIRHWGEEPLRIPVRRKLKVREVEPIPEALGDYDSQSS